MNPWTLSGDSFFVYTHLCLSEICSPAPAAFFYHIFIAFGHLIGSQTAKNRTFIIHPYYYTCVLRVAFYYIYQIVQLP
jgi:hypothetical protein